jgi:hypothetical protein
LKNETSVSGAAQDVKVTIPEMVEYLVSKGYESDYSMEDFRRGVSLLEKKLK